MKTQVIINNNDDEEEIERHPVVFKFYQDQVPFNKLGEIKTTIETLPENIIVKQLLEEPENDTFAVAFYSEIPQFESSVTLLFKRDNTGQLPGWGKPHLFKQKNSQRIEKLINAFHIDSRNGQLFTLFREETLLILRAESQIPYSTLSY